VSGNLSVVCRFASGGSYSLTLGNPCFRTPAAHCAAIAHVGTGSACFLCASPAMARRFVTPSQRP